MDPKTALRPGNLSDVVRSRIGPAARCPRCDNEIEFTVYLTTDVVSVSIIADGRVSRPWMITDPSLGVLKIKDVRCARCGYRNTAQHFSTRKPEKPHEEDRAGPDDGRGPEPAS